MPLHPPGDKLVDLTTAVARISDGALLALGGGLSARLPMAMVRELVRQGRRDLHLIGSAHSIDVDLLVAASAVSYDATLSAYRSGAGTITAALEAQRALLAARNARGQAHGTAQIAAATLAFAMGSATNARAFSR